MDKQFPCRLGCTEMLLQIHSQCLHVLSLILLIMLLQFQQPFMTDHCSRQSSCCLFQNISQCHLTEIMNPQIRLLTASYIQSRLRLHILPSQIHMSCHHPAVSGFQISIPDKINQFSGYFLLAFSKSGKVKKCHNFILIKKTHRILKFLLNISADCLCGKILLIQIGNLQDQAHIFMISAPSQFTQFSAHLHIIRSPVRQNSHKNLLHIPVRIFFLRFMRKQILQFLHQNIQYTDNSQCNL